MPGMSTWDECLATPTGASIIVVSVSGALARPRKDGLGDARTAVIEHYEVIGNMIAIVTMNTLTGWHNGYVVGPGKSLPQEGEWANIAFYSTFDGSDIRIEADGGIKIVGTESVATKSEAISEARMLTGRATGISVASSAG